MFNDPIPDFTGAYIVNNDQALWCGYAPSPCVSPCHAPASWHVYWYRMGSLGYYMLLCEKHMRRVQANNVYQDRHRVAAQCNTPGWRWVDGDPSFCVVPGQEARHEEEVPAEFQRSLA